MGRNLQVVLLAVAFGAPAGAADPCANPPSAADTYLKAHPDWKILARTDLVADDQKLWRQYHKSHCPGMAEVDLDGSGKKFVGLALIRHGNGEELERVVVVRAGSSGLETHTIYSDFKVPTYTVIWRVGPGITWEWDEPSKKIRIPNDSLVAATMEAAAQQYYLKDGKFHYVQTSD